MDPAAAQDAVLRENLFGLELDPRCTQIAMFALALEAWKQGGFREIPVPQVACSGIPAKAPLSEWTKLAEGDDQLEAALTRLHALFADADTLGLADRSRSGPPRTRVWSRWTGTTSPPATSRHSPTKLTDTGDPAAEVFGDAAAGIARAADYLTRHYTLIATNLPYLQQQAADRCCGDCLTRVSRSAQLGPCDSCSHERCRELGMTWRSSRRRTGCSSCSY